ncbi:MAG: hypothetical protein R2814_13955 [Flavobacteriaceae bacterium]
MKLHPFLCWQTALPAKEGVLERNGILCQGLDSKLTVGKKQYAVSCK